MYYHWIENSSGQVIRPFFVMRADYFIWASSGTRSFTAGRAGPRADYLRAVRAAGRFSADGCGPGRAAGRHSAGRAGPGREISARIQLWCGKGGGGFAQIKSFACGDTKLESTYVINCSECS